MVLRPSQAAKPETLQPTTKTLAQESELVPLFPHNDCRCTQLRQLWESKRAEYLPEECRVCKVVTLQEEGEYQW
jgi:hypothetical protein